MRGFLIRKHFKKLCGADRDFVIHNFLRKLGARVSPYFFAVRIKDSHFFKAIGICFYDLQLCAMPVNYAHDRVDKLIRGVVTGRKGAIESLDLPDCQRHASRVHTVTDTLVLGGAAGRMLMSRHDARRTLCNIRRSDASGRRHFYRLPRPQDFRGVFSCFPWMSFLSPVPRIEL